MDSFQAKGYKLANKYYQNCDREVSVILGINTLHLLETKVVTFGHKDDLSAYLESHFGVILMGSKFSMRENLSFLTAVSTFSCEVNEPENKNACEIVSRGIEICTSIIDLKGQIEESEIVKATEATLEENCDTYLNLEKDVPEKLMSDLNVELCDFMLKNAVRDDQSGRLVMPLPWNPQVKHLIDDSFHLAKQVLDHNVKKLKKDEQKLIQYNEVLSKQESEGIIERIPDLETLLNENPQGLSFLAHNGVFRPDHQSTKCWIVFLSNLHGNKHRLSHNHVSLPGPNLNQKLSTSLTLLRFNKYLITFDLKQAFLQLMVRPEGTKKLLFLWYSDALKEAKSLIAYRFLRLPFGLRFSPFVLMIALYIILLESDSTIELRKFKRDLYEIACNDNLAWTSNDETSLVGAYHDAIEIFDNYKFKLQQFHTNHAELQTKLSDDGNEVSEDKCTLFGMLWLKDVDKLSVKPFELNIGANTKRLILSSLHSVFDIFGIYLPILNRARLFLHRLQMDRGLDWDTPLAPKLQREWTNIVKQVGNSPVIEIDRSFGQREDS